jgi:hypothetical protein
MWVALALYVCMTVVVPLVNGAPADRAFLVHSAIVLIVSAFAAALSVVLKHICRH